MVFYNFLTRRKERFKPIKAGRVGLYTCGPTVYDYVHIGNLRTYVFEDILRRALEFNGYRVKHVTNITDIDDKIIRKSEEEKKDYKSIGRRYSKLFFDDLNKLNIKKADIYPKATEYIGGMLKLIEKLDKKGYAYKGEDGSVYYRISKFRNYGKLSELDKREIKSGTRISLDEYQKEEAQDFVLWKAKRPKEPSWPSKYGDGRPGGHIECSAMSMKNLGKHFDIHAGAIDLVFPHHENEIAQSEGATGKKFVNFFLEGEHLLIDGQKMSKSLHNIYKLSDLEERGIDPLAFRYLTLSTHYRAKLNFTWESVNAAQNALHNLCLSILRVAAERSLKKSYPESEKTAYKTAELFKKAIDDDLRTPGALSTVWEVVNSEEINPKEKIELILKFDKILGLGLAEVLKKYGRTPVKIKRLIDEREKSRVNKQFIQADSLRKKIEQLGYTVEDTAKGPLVVKKI